MRAALAVTLLATTCAAPQAKGKLLTSKRPASIKPPPSPPPPPATSCNAKTTCNGHGVCDANFECKCAPGYIAPFCRKGCTSQMSGDFQYEACAEWCRVKQDNGNATNHCAFCKCRSCTFWTPRALDLCREKMAIKLGAKWKAHNATVHREKKNEKKKIAEKFAAKDEGGPRDMRAVKKIDEWLGIKPKVPTAWQKLESMLRNGTNFIRGKASRAFTGSSAGHGAGSGGMKHSGAGRSPQHPPGAASTAQASGAAKTSAAMGKGSGGVSLKKAVKMDAMG